MNGVNNVKKILEKKFVMVVTINSGKGAITDALNNLDALNDRHALNIMDALYDRHALNGGIKYDFMNALNDVGENGCYEGRWGEVMWKEVEN